MKPKALLALLLLLCLFSGAALASGEDSYVIPATLTRANPKGSPQVPDNPLVPGVSPVTGMPLSQDRPYLPILVQIDNNQGAIPQWGISKADIIYEMPIMGQGWTRLTALFSDQYPRKPDRCAPAG